MEHDHFSLARGAEINHGEAVILARTFCPSGNGTGSHGSLSPCDKCTYKAVTTLIEKKGNPSSLPGHAFRKVKT